MARPEVIKTPLGQRLRDIRKRFGDPERDDFASRLGISKGSLANYERGDRVPDSDVLAAYQRLGVNLNWVVSGDGSIFIADPNGPDTGVDVVIMTKLHDRVQAVYLQVKQKAPPRRITEEAANLYNQLRSAVTDLEDPEEVEATLPRLEFELKKRLQKAETEPGTGKRSA